MFWVKTIQWDPPLCLAFSFIRRKPIRVSERKLICSFVNVFLISDRDLSTAALAFWRERTLYNFLELVVLCFSWSCLYFKHFTPVVINFLICFFMNFMVVFSLIEPPFIFDLWHFLFMNHLWKYLCQMLNLAYYQYEDKLLWLKLHFQEVTFFANMLPISHKTLKWLPAPFFVQRGWGSSGGILFLYKFTTSHPTGVLSL